MGFQRIVRAGEREEHVAAIRAEGIPDYAVRPEGSREVLAPVVFIEPFKGANVRVLGFDPLAERTRREALERARDAGTSVLSAAVTLVQESDAQGRPGAILYLPVYAGGGVPNTEEERRARILGWVYLAFRVQDLMAGALGERAPDLDVEIRDGATPSSGSMLYDPDGNTIGLDQPAAHLQAAHPLKLAGHTWTLVVRSTGRFEQRLGADRPRIVAVVGITASLLLAALVMLFATGAAGRQARATATYTRSLIEASLDPLVTISPDGRITDTNRATEEATGIPRSRIVGTDFAGYFTEPEKARAGYEQVLVQGEVRDYPLTLRHESGRAIDVLFNATVYKDPGGRVQGVYAAARDVSGRKRAEEALRASEAKYRHLFDSLMDGFVVVGMDGFIRESNEVYRKMLGYSAEELAQLTYKDLTPERWHPVEARVVEQIIRHGYSDVYEKEYRRKDGTVFPVELRTFLLRKDGRADAMWAIVRDVTEARALQAQLTLASRLAAMGTLVAGVAHEVNNPLAAVLADRGVASEVVQEVRERLRTSEPIDRQAEAKRLDEVIEALEDAEEGGRRIAQIVKDLAKFARPNEEKARVRLIDAVQQAMRWLPATVGRAATVNVEDGGAPDVLASFGQIEQVVVNLVTNAAKASKPGELGVVIVRTSPGSPGMSRLEVIDKGVGIDPAARDRIFDPFFTTRQVGEGKGMGLGLSICHSIVTRHGGTLTVQSEIGKGSTFRLELPAVPAEA